MKPAGRRNLEAAFLLGKFTAQGIRGWCWVEKIKTVVTITAQASEIAGTDKRWFEVASFISVSGICQEGSGIPLASVSLFLHFWTRSGCEINLLINLLA